MCPTAEQERGATTSSESNLRPSTASGAPVAVLRPDGLGGSREEKQAERDISWQELTHAHRIARLGTWTWVRATGAVVNSPELYAIYGIDPGQTVDLFADGEDSTPRTVGSVSASPPDSPLTPETPLNWTWRSFTSAPNPPG